MIEMKERMNEDDDYDGKNTYRKFNKAKDKNGPKAPKIRIRKETTKKGQKKHCPNKVCHYVCRF